MDLVQIVILALFVEAIWETLKMCWQEGESSVNRIGCLVLSALFALLCGANLFAAVGLDLAAGWLGCLCTGILISRGSNFIHDLLGRVNAKKED